MVGRAEMDGGGGGGGGDAASPNTADGIPTLEEREYPLGSAATDPDAQRGQCKTPTESGGAAGDVAPASVSQSESRSWEDMALFMDKIPEDPEENADLAALRALQYDDEDPEETAESLKEQGNRMLKKGHKFYREAKKLYTHAIAQNSPNSANHSVYYANRAHVNLLLGNSQRAFVDAVQATRHNADNIKAYFRATKAALALDWLDKAADQCAVGLAKDSGNTDLQKLKMEIDKKRAQQEIQARKEAESRAAAERLVDVLAQRKVKIGPQAFREWTGSRRPWLEEDGVLHFPVLLLYGEVMSTDLIEDFGETESFGDHLDQMFGKDAPPLEWDHRREYKRRKIELYFQTNAHPVLSKPALTAIFMEGQAGTVGGGRGIEQEEDSDIRLGLKEKRWVRVDERATLAGVLAKPGHVIPGVPVFYVVASGTQFREILVSGQWTPP